MVWGSSAPAACESISNTFYRGLCASLFFKWNSMLHAGHRLVIGYLQLHSVKSESRLKVWLIPSKAGSSIQNAIVHLPLTAPLSELIVPGRAIEGRGTAVETFLYLRYHISCFWTMQFLGGTGRKKMINRLNCWPQIEFVKDFSSNMGPKDTLLQIHRLALCIFLSNVNSSCEVGTALGYPE